MSANIAMTSFEHKLLDREPCKKPRWRFMRYYMDLMALYGKEIPEDVFSEGSQYTYSELGQEILDPLFAAGCLQNLDLLIVSYWANEFDPDHATCGAYLSHRYGLECKIFDVCEQGTIAPFTAIKIIQQFINYSETKKAVLLILEQTTIPRVKADYDLIPQHSGAIAITFEPSTASDAMHLMVADVIQENVVVENTTDLFRYVLRKYLPTNVLHRDVIFHLRKNDFLWKLFQLTQNKTKPFNSRDFSSAPGCFPAFISLTQCLESDVTYHVLLDQDVETLNIGVMILKKN